MNLYKGYIVVKEYSKVVEGLDFLIKARILKRKVLEKDHSDFAYEISHYYKPSEAAMSVYIPGDNTGKTFEEAEYKLFFYLNPFRPIGVQENKSW